MCLMPDDYLYLIVPTIDVWEILLVDELKLNLKYMCIVEMKNHR